MGFCFRASVGGILFGHKLRPHADERQLHGNRHVRRCEPNPVVRRGDGRRQSGKRISDSEDRLSGRGRFADDLRDELTIGNFKNGGVPTSLYSGSRSPVLAACSNKDCQWSGFGNTNNAAAFDGPQHLLSLQELSFTVSKGISITDVR
jgi:hypothetical protein